MRGFCCCFPSGLPDGTCGPCDVDLHDNCPHHSGRKGEARALRRFRKNRVSPLRGTPEVALSLEEQECGTWYGCRWKAHQPVLKVEGLWFARHNRCAQCGQYIVYEGGDPDGQYGEWIVHQHVIHEEAEI